MLEEGDREALGLPGAPSAWEEVHAALAGRVDLLEKGVPKNALRLKP